jgi:alkylation response protein AidB-like acyl-CoA dehydrogenase
VTRIKQEYLAQVFGDKIGFCVQIHGGSDVAGMRTTAVRKGDYVINGSKTFIITNGVLHDYCCCQNKSRHR